MSWRDQAACRGLDGAGGRVDFLELAVLDQRRRCMACPVRQACLDDALVLDAAASTFDQAAGVLRGGRTALERAAQLPRSRASRESPGARYA